ncbi:MAG: ThuA domain-containing protein [Pirellulales bacterium]|nr:ThuA domain-containing protein [Pirellulales bacterium]
MKRRDMLLSTGAALGLSLFPVRWLAAAEDKPRKVLFFTRSAGFEHSAVKREGGQLSVSEQTLVELGKEHNVEVVATKDGRVFDGDLDQYDAIAFYTSGDLTQPNAAKTPPMTAEGKKRLLDAVADGKGFVGIHSATDTFHSQGDAIDPFIAMLGGEFVSHGDQQMATLRVASPKFPGLGEGNPPPPFKYHEEWYAMNHFAKDLHVILVQETEGMKGDCYQRPPFPATWARKHGQGRVFYTSLGHRHEIWAEPRVQELLVGGFGWAMGLAEADVTPNIAQVAPHANRLTRD